MKTQLRQHGIAALGSLFLAFGSLGMAQAGDWFVTRPGNGVNHPALLHFNGGGGFLGLTDAANYAEGLQGIAIGRDGNVYVSDNTLGDGSVLRFNRQTGAFMNHFVAWGANSLTDPYGITFGPDGNLYVASVRWSPGTGFGPGRVFRYDGNTGVPVENGPFVQNGVGGLQWPHDTEFGADGVLYVSDAQAGVLKFNGTTGAFLGTAAAIGSGGLATPSGIAFGTDGLLYVADATANRVLRFATDGSYQGVLVNTGSGGLLEPDDIDFGSDGNLYVAAAGNNTVLRYDGGSGQFLGEFTVGASQYFDPSGPAFLCEVPEPQTSALVAFGLVALGLGRKVRSPGRQGSPASSATGTATERPGLW